MKIAKLLHNPTAGEEEHDKNELISIIKAKGFECRYSSTKNKAWKKIAPDIDFLIAAGGDGTVRKITKELLDRKVLEKTWPIALLPLGTSNNIATTLGISGTTERIVHSWHDATIKKYDVGKISDHIGEEFFLESFGYGIFPYLMLEMEKQDKNSIESAELKMQAALELLHEIILAYEPRLCKLEVDGKDYSGKFSLAEIMNTRSIGPNLFLSPDGDPGDGEMEVVLVPEDQKNKFAAHVLSKINGKEEQFSLPTIKAKNVRMAWTGTHVHVDDKILKTDTSSEVQIEVKEGLLEFMVPAE